MVVIAGSFTPSMPVSEITHTSAFNSSALASRKGSRFSDALSSSPSMSTETRTGSRPCTAFQAASASSQVMSWPLSSTAPRATTRGPCGPWTMRGSKGGLSHSRKGSGGCTS